jgi:hypothetical protein
MFDKVDETTLKFPEEMRKRRIEELASRITELSRRKEEAAASYDRVIALEQSELDGLKNQKPAAPDFEPTRRPIKTIAARCAAAEREVVLHDGLLKPASP